MQITAGIGGPDMDKALRVGNSQGMQERGVDQAEDSGVGADAEGESEDSDSGEAGRSAKETEGETEVEEKVFEAGPAPDGAAVLFGKGEVAEFAAGLVCGFAAGCASSDEVFDFFFEVGPELLRKLGGETAAG